MHAPAGFHTRYLVTVAEVVHDLSVVDSIR